MTESTEKPSQVAEYLIAQLERNPQLQSSEIIAKRARALRVTTKSTSNDVDYERQARQRKQVIVQLDWVRAQCFKASVDELREKLAKLPVDDYPDLQALAARLQTCVDVRMTLPALSQNPDFDGQFWSVFRDVLIGKPRDVAVTREKVIASLRKSQVRKRVRRMIELLERRAPELYALEKDWLESLKRIRGGQKNVAYATTQTQTESDGNSWPMIAIVIIVIGLARVAIYAQRDNDKPKPKPYTPQFDQQMIQQLNEQGRQLYQPPSPLNDSNGNRSVVPGIPHVPSGPQVERFEPTRSPGGFPTPVRARSPSAPPSFRPRATLPGGGASPRSGIPRPSSPSNFGGGAPRPNLP